MNKDVRTHRVPELQQEDRQKKNECIPHHSILLSLLSDVFSRTSLYN